ncbi:MAG: ATP-binding protein [bacterium]|nr:ATP-binding protein [bacterium]
MNRLRRYLTPALVSGLAKAMAYLAGPRRVGKTTVAKVLLSADEGYLHWAVAEHQERILKSRLPAGPLWVFEGIHEFSFWQSYLKGFFQSRPPGQKVLVSFNASPDFYQYSDDPLAGRYHLFRLHPLSVVELGISTPVDLHQLFTLGGFPEPFLSGSEAEARRWSREYRDLLIEEELMGLDEIRDFDNLERLIVHLPELVGSRISFTALGDQLKLSHLTVGRWLRVLEEFFVVFRLSPYVNPELRTLTKSRRYYHFDWTLVADRAARFENLVASHLLKWVHHQQDTRGRSLELHHYRDYLGRELNFVVTENGEPLTLVAYRWADTEIDSHLIYLKNHFPDSEAWQISAVGRRDFVSPQGIRVCPALVLLRTLV